MNKKILTTNFMDSNIIKGKVFLKEKKEEIVKSFHSWIFSGAIQKVISKKDFINGDIIEIYSYKEEFLGYGFYEKPDPIAIRMFYFDADPILDFKQYFINLLNTLYLKKKNLFEDSNCFRFIHSESDKIPGIICDIYNNLCVIQIDFIKSEFFLNILIEFLYSKNYKYILLKEKNKNIWISSPIDTISFTENQIHFYISLKEFQKTGYYLDQKINRKILQKYAKNKKILDCFCYLGSFGIHSLKEKAERVVFVDSKNFKNLIMNTINLNHLSHLNTEFYNQDAFLYLKNLPKNEFDIIVVDPPAFVKTKQKIKEGIKGYVYINQMAIEKIKSNGYIFTFSCSQHINTELFRKIIFIASRETKRNVNIIEFLTQSPDHTINIYHPQGEYLKGVVLYVE